MPWTLPQSFGKLEQAGKERKSALCPRIKFMSFKITTIGKSGEPSVAIVACVHGDENIGAKIISRIKKLDIQKGVVSFIIANPKALKRKKRFVAQDLNRSFPGDKNGNYEERIAHGLAKELQNYDYVIDIHSTTTDVKNSVIAAKLNKPVKRLIKFFSPEKVVLMPLKMAKNSLIYHCGAGVSFEYGKDGCAEAYKKTLDDILLILSRLKITGDASTPRGFKTKFYKVTEEIAKPRHCAVNKDIKNFKLVKRGETLCAKRGVKIKAKKDFYPVLFGEKAYKDILGFAARPIKSI